MILFITFFLASKGFMIKYWHDFQARMDLNLDDFCADAITSLFIILKSITVTSLSFICLYFIVIFTVCINGSFKTCSTRIGTYSILVFDMSLTHYLQYILEIGKKYTIQNPILVIH